MVLKSTFIIGGVFGDDLDILLRLEAAESRLISRKTLNCKTPIVSPVYYSPFTLHNSPLLRSSSTVSFHPVFKSYCGLNPNSS